MASQQTLLPGTTPEAQTVHLKGLQPAGMTNQRCIRTAHTEASTHRGIPTFTDWFHLAPAAFVSCVKK